MSDPWGDGGGGGVSASAGRSCPWCSAEAGPSDTKCPQCGAALAQRDALGDLVIPGVTDVDPDMQQASSPTAPILRGQSRYATVNAMGVIGGPSAGIATAAALLAPDYLGDVLSGLGGAPDASHVGEVSEAARLAAERLDRDEAGRANPSAPELGPQAGPSRGDEPERGLR